jgi:hypothetical protein
LETFFFVETKGVGLAASGMRSFPENYMATPPTNKNPSQHIHRSEVEKRHPGVVDEHLLGEKR